MTPGRRQFAAFMSLVSFTAFGATLFGCSEDADPILEKSPPSITMVATNARCQVGRNILPVATLEAVRAQQVATPGTVAPGLDTISVVLNGVDPNNSSGAFAANTKVVISQVEDAEGRGRGVFVTTNEETSGEIPFQGATANTRMYCLSPGIVQLTAKVEGYRAGGTGDPTDVVTRDSFPVRCVTAAEFAEDCGLVPNLDAGTDGGDSDAGDAGVDGGDGGDAGDSAIPAAWALQFAGPTADLLVINTIGSGAGRPSSVQLVFAALDRGEPLAGVPVSFKLVGTSAAGVRVDPVETVTDSEGLAVTRVFAGDSPGVTSVQAEATYEDRTQTERTPTINIRLAKPSARGMTMGCLDRVVPAFEERSELDPQDWIVALGQLTSCSVQLADYLGGRVDVRTQVFFAIEAGSITQAALTDEEGLATALLRKGNPVPWDTDPEVVEVAEGQAEIGEQSLSPRDGLVGVIAITRGEEDFIDIDGSGHYDPGIDDFVPGLHDLGEPYIDENDNGQYDVGETYRDSNGDEAWTPGDGEWSNDIDIWVSGHVLWVGLMNRDKSYQMVDCEGCVNQMDRGCSVVAQPGEGAIVSLRALYADSNFNCPAGRLEGGLTVETEGGLELIEGEEETPWVGGETNLCFGVSGPRAGEARFAFRDVSEPYAEGDDRLPPSKITITATYRNVLEQQVAVSTRFTLCYTAP